MPMSSFKIYLLTKLVKNKKFSILIFAILLAIFCLPSISSFAYFQLEPDNFVDQIQQFTKINNTDEPRIIKLYVTAYTSAAAETDTTPCIAASGYNLCQHDLENVVASNFLPFGAKIKFPELDPEQVYTVVDRMHERYDSRIDIWKKTQTDAKIFGKKFLTIEIYR
jgi:3D (Asp-Asp-Asp) domain-containing protein